MNRGKTAPPMNDALVEQAALRRQAYDARNAQEHKDEVSGTIIERFVALPEYGGADGDVVSRLPIRAAHPPRAGRALASGKRIVVPYCTVDEQGANKLGLWWLRAWTSWWWASGRFSSHRASAGESRARKSTRANWTGDGSGRGLHARRPHGNGQGYYDRLLERVRPTAPLVALASSASCFRTSGRPHDIFMDKVVTEKAVYPGRGATRTRVTTDVRPLRSTTPTPKRSEHLRRGPDHRPRSHWLDHAVHAATGNASSTILCDCEAGLDRYVGPGGDESFARPTAGPARSCSFTCRVSQGPRRSARARAAGADQPERADVPDDRLLQPARYRRRTSSSAARSRSSATAISSATALRPEVWVVPILGGEFVIDRRFGYRDGLMGGNLWFFGEDLERRWPPPSGPGAVARRPA